LEERMLSKKTIELAIASINTTHSEIWNVDYESRNPKIVEIIRGESKDAISELESYLKELEDEKIGKESGTNLTIDDKDSTDDPSKYWEG
jgi:hypothetical protein